MLSSLIVAVIQLKVGVNKADNVLRAVNKITESSKKGAQLVILPECFNSPYGTKYFEEYSEEIPGGETIKSLSKAAAMNNVWLIGGTIPERHQGKLYNTSTVYSPQGDLITKYRKMHLFDIDIPGKITFKESKVLTPGNEFSTFDINEFKIGLGICYDLRFPEFSSILTTKAGCNVLVFPSAFNTTTGPLHWHILQRGRAIDSQSYVITASPARNIDSEYNAYGHSMIVNPMGQILAEAAEDEEIIYADIKLEDVTEMRSNIPIHQQKRKDIYTLPTC